MKKGNGIVVVRAAFLLILAYNLFAFATSYSGYEKLANSSQQALQVSNEFILLNIIRIGMVIAFGLVWGVLEMTAAGGLNAVKDTKKSVTNDKPPIAGNVKS
ncbi:Uncharacterised protein [Chlamydia abortus]|nr:Uncharacterised protein [Chlamydia abortus]